MNLQISIFLKKMKIFNFIVRAIKTVHELKTAITNLNKVGVGLCACQILDFYVKK